MGLECLVQHCGLSQVARFPGLTAAQNSSHTPDTHQFLVVILQLFADLSIRLVCTCPVLDTSDCEDNR